jgi:exodeoxyribonuclease VII large subunit
MKYVLSVSEINRYIREIISRDLVLSNLWVKGEISNYKYHYSGHLYFTLKDEKSLLKCVMFKTHAQNLKFMPENGMKVLIHGYVSIFERDGQYQLYAEDMQPDGIGNLHVAFEQLKKKLMDEGLFEQDKKKKIPLLPDSIGVVTSVTGAAIRDIINVLGRRYPNFRLKIFPVQVQGEGAARQIAAAVRRLNELKCVDVIILARGGGSIEELWAFNEEVVARSIYESEIPVISAVGHETDYTIADFTADLRAPTPSAAAELVLPEKQLLRYRINNMRSRIETAVNRRLSMNRMRCERLKDSVSFRQPYNMVYQNRMRLDALNKYLRKALEMKTGNLDMRIRALTGKLDSLSPLKVLSRGYGIVKMKETGVIIKSKEAVKQGDELQITVEDGMFDCVVRE